MSWFLQSDCFWNGHVTFESTILSLNTDWELEMCFKEALTCDRTIIACQISSPLKQKGRCLLHLWCLTTWLAFYFTSYCIKESVIIKRSLLSQLKSFSKSLWNPLKYIFFSFTCRPSERSSDSSWCFLFRHDLPSELRLGRSNFHILPRK